MVYSKHLLRTAAVLLVSAALIVPAQVSASADTAVHTTAASPVTHILASTKAFSKAPVPKVTGVRQVGKVLTAVAGTWKSKPTTLRYQWTRNGKPVAHATAKTYTLGATDGGTRVGVVVTAKRSGYKTTSRTSAVSVIALATFVKATRPTIAGTVKVGSQLSAQLGVWTPAPTPSYQWKVSGKPIPGATRATYTIRSSDVAHQISVTVTGKRSGYKPVVSTSLVTKAVPVVPVATAGVPGDGWFLVSSEVLPGTYVAQSTTDDCLWGRWDDDSDDADPISAGSGAGQRIVTIATTDKGFYTEGCGSWVPIATVPMPALAVLPDSGAFAVGSQVQTGGLYTASDVSPDCYWGFSSDFSGNEASWMSADYVEGSDDTVQVPAGAALFEVNGCGTWTRISN